MSKPGRKAAKAATGKVPAGGVGDATSSAASNAHIETFDAEVFLRSTGPGRSTVIRKAKGVIFQQGGPCDAIFYIQTGRVQLTVASDQGKIAVIAILGPGDFFGEGCIGGQPLHLSSASAISATTLLKIEKTVMIGLLHDQRELSERFIAFLLSRNIRIEEDLVDQLFNSSEVRLARLLLTLAHIGKGGKFEPVIPKISQGLLASRIGTTRARINHFMNKFRKLGFIEYNGELKVHSSLLRVVVHD